MALSEHKIQVYLEDLLYRRARRAAQEGGKSMAGLFRDAMAYYLQRNKKADIEEGYRRLTKMAGFFADKGIDSGRLDDLSWSDDE